MSLILLKKAKPPFINRRAQRIPIKPTQAPVWIGFPGLVFRGLPVNLYNDEFLRSIAGNIGPVMRIHEATLACTETSEALVCVEPNILQPRKKRIWIGYDNEGFWQPIRYHRLPAFCNSCQKLGHKEDVCAKNRSKNLPKQNPDSMSSGKKEDTSKAGVEAGWEPSTAST